MNDAVATLTTLISDNSFRVQGCVAGAKNQVAQHDLSSTIFKSSRWGVRTYRGAPLLLRLLLLLVSLLELGELGELLNLIGQGLSLLAKQFDGLVSYLRHRVCGV